MEIEEKGVKLRLTIVDTPGFNDAIIGEQKWVSYYFLILLLVCNPAANFASNMSESALHPMAFLCYFFF